MCHNCKRKMAFSLAALFATGAIAFTADDNDPEDNQHASQAIPDMARILQVEMMRCVPENQRTEELSQKISAVLLALRNEIGGPRFAFATMEMISMYEALHDGAQLAAAMIALEAGNGVAGAQRWMERYGNRVGYEADAPGVAIPDDVPPAVADAIRAVAAKMPPGTQIFVTSQPQQRADKPVGTGPNGELH